MIERRRSQGRGKENYFHQSFCWNVFKYKIERKDRKSLVHYKSSWIWCPRKPQALKKCITFSLKKVCCLSSAFCRVSFRVFRKGYTFLAEDFQTWNLAKRFADSFGNNKNGWGNFWFFWFKPNLTEWFDEVKRTYNKKRLTKNQ